MSEKLLPCPFCGGNARALEDGDKFYVTCFGDCCNVAMGERYDRDALPDHFFDSQEEAALAWNTRSNPSHAQLAAARSALGKAATWLEGWASAEPYLSEIRNALSTLAQEPAGQSEAKPVAWLRDLIGAECKSDGRCYDIVFCDPRDSRYRPLYAHPTVKVSGNAIPDSARALTREQIKSDKTIIGDAAEMRERAAQEAHAVAFAHAHHALWDGIIEYGWNEATEKFGRALANQIADAVRSTIRALPLTPEGRS